MMMVWPLNVIMLFMIVLVEHQIHIMTLCALVAVVGFERIFISVNEGTGLFQSCIHVITNASLLPINTEFFLGLLSVPASASNILIYVL